MPDRLASRLVFAAATASLLLVALVAGPASAESPASSMSGAALHDVGPVPHVAWTLPFAALLAAIAVLPLIPAAHHWWEHNPNKLLVGLGLATVVLGYYGLRDFGYHGHAPGLATLRAVVEHAIVQDYLPFMVLLFSLYVTSGGLQLRGDLRAHPSTNTGLLALGAVAASLIGTTGASMVLIRPLLQTNSERKHVKHTVIFFIFLVSNIGGCLLPMGDPPLFLGYLQGVPFTWTLSKIVVLPWLASVSALLAVYYAWDCLAYRHETKADIRAEETHTEPIRLRGSINLLWLLGIVLSVALIVPGRPLPGTSIVVGDYQREAVMLILAGLSLATTPRGLRREVEFTYGAIGEVACLFLGIFLTMQVPIEILRAKGGELGLSSPVQFFWATGGLSSFLDNAPTYLVLFETAKAQPSAGSAVVRLLDGSLIREDLLLAISLGAVFMGANTYIGNGPNFMVKAIASQQGVKMPGFFGYMLYSATILIPLFVVIGWAFIGRM